MVFTSISRLQKFNTPISVKKVDKKTPWSFTANIADIEFYSTLLKEKNYEKASIFQAFW